jgi:hypothetical protein
MLCGGHLSKLPRQVIVLFDGQLFLPGEQGFAQGYYPAESLAPNKHALFPSHVST